MSVTNGMLQAINRDAQKNVGIGGQQTQETGQQLNLQEIEFPSFAGGLNYQSAEQQTEPQFTQNAEDVVFVTNDKLRRAPGHEVVETMSGRVIRGMLVHPSLDFTSELVLFDPPFVGIKGTGDTIWADVSLPLGGSWVGITNGDDFLCTNGGTGIYTRLFATGPGLSLIPNAPPGRTLANFAGRVLVGGPVVSSNYQALGVYWSGASGFTTDWLGLGSGAELLISNNAEDDAIVAFRPLSFDVLGILCRKSIWVGLRTGDPFRPVDFQPRVTGDGCVSEKTAKLTPIGVMYLSEVGVKVFDGNQSSLVSSPVNDVLLPVNLDNLSQYSAVYDSVTQQYWLFTSTGSWAFSLRSNRWLRYSSVIEYAASYSQLSQGTTWNAATGIWDDAVGTWNDFASQAGAQELLFSRASQLAVTSFAENTYLGGASVVGKYGFLRRDTPYVNSFFTTKRFFIRADAPVEFDLSVYLPNNNGSMTLAGTRTLPALNAIDGKELGFNFTGRGVGGELRWTNVDFKLGHGSFSGLFRSRRRGTL